jgi:hypothetical protein
MATVASPMTPSTPTVIQRAKRQYGRPKLAARPDVLSGPTNRTKDSTIESSSVVEDSEPERARYRECFASTDLSDPPTSANKNNRFGNWRHELERIDAGESLEPYWPSGAPFPHVACFIPAAPACSSSLRCLYTSLFLFFFFFSLIRI